MACCHMATGLVNRANGSAQLVRQDGLLPFLHAYDVQQEVVSQLNALNKGYVLKALLTGLPIATTVISIVGSLYTVYSSTDCQGSAFAARSRSFLYTSLAYTLTNTVMDKALSANLRFLINRPNLAFALYCTQAGVLTAFLVAMVTLLALVIKSACPAVRRKVMKRLT